MAARFVKVIKTGVGRGYERLRIVLNLRNDQVARLGWIEGTEVEAVDHKDGILLRKK